MRQSQHCFQYAQQGAARAALLRRCAVLQLHLGEFHVPIAVFIPHQFVNCIGRIVEAILCERGSNVGLGAL